MTTVANALWHRYRETGDPDTRTLLLERYLGLVYHVARGIHQRVHHAVEFGDLVSAGTIGLVGALETFDIDRGFAFSTFATQRIRGAMLDELRACDHRPRSVRDHARQLDAAATALRAERDRPPTPTEIAGHLGIDLATYWRWKDESATGSPTGLDTPEDGGTTPADRIEDLRAILPDENIQQRESAAILRQAIADLPLRARTVLTLYYYEELNQRQIAEVLHVTESRVSQIRSETLRLLRTRLAPAFVEAP